MKIAEYKLILNSNRHPRLKKVASYDTDNGSISKPSMVYDILHTIFNLDSMAEEFVYLICLDTKNKILGCFETGHGTVNACYCTPREILIRALLLGAVSIIVAHNHPSNIPLPSNNDVDFYYRLKDACELVGIRLLDSIIIGAKDYISIREIQEAKEEE